MEIFSDQAGLYVGIVALWLVSLTVFVLVFRKYIGTKAKIVLFWLLIIPVVLVSLHIAGYTIYENIVSESGGPVHWHADYEVWACGEKLDLLDPEFPSNKIGSPLLHEHNDDRMHVEGTLRSIQDVDLQSYFAIIGGELTPDHLTYPSTKGIVSFRTGESCGTAPATLKVYVNGKRVENFWDYVLYPSLYAPPGDCIIIMFDESTSNQTDKLCTTWEAAGWNYDTFTRPALEIGEHTWQ